MGIKILHVKSKNKPAEKNGKVKYKMAYNLEKIGKKVDLVLELAKRVVSKAADTRKGESAIDTACKAMYTLMQFNPKYLEPQLKLTKIRKIFMDLNASF